MQVVIQDEELDDARPDSNDQFRQDLQTAVANFVGRSSVSAAVGCSDSMRELIVQVIRISHQFFTLDHVFNPEQIVTRISPRRMRKSIKELGDRVFETVLDHFAPYRFVNIMLDAGTMLNKGYVHVMISNPYSSENPLPFEIFPKDGPADWNRHDYLNALESQVARLLSMSSSLIPVAICHDRLLAQSMAVEHLVRSLANREGDGLPVIDCPCLNHLLNTVFTHSKKMPVFNDLISKVTRLATFLRKRQGVSFLRRRCPFPPETRWLYICDTLAFLYRYRDSIICYFLHNNPEATPESVKSEYLLPIFHEVYLLLPLKELSLCFEQRACRLADVIPLLETTFDLFRSIRSKVSDDTLPILFKIVLEMRILFELYLPEEAWASWALTRSGRSFLCMRNQSPGMCRQTDEQNQSLCDNELIAKLKGNVMNVLENFERDEIVQPFCQDDIEVTSDEGDADFCSDECLYDESSDSLESIYADGGEPSSDIENSLEIETSDECGKSIDEWNSHDEDASEAMHIREETDAHNARERLSSLSLDALLDISWSENTYWKALSTLKRYYGMITRDMSEENDDICMCLFDQWLGFTDTTMSQWCADMTRQNVGDLGVWQHIFKHDELRAFADMAMRLITAAVGESEVERLFPRQRHLLGDTMTNITPDILLARLRISTAAPHTIAELQTKT